MIVAEQVSKWFGAHAAVRELSFEAPKGALVGLLGLNGAGKTTTLRMLAGLTAPTSGRLTLAGHPAASKEARAAVGYLPDRPPLWPDMRVRAFVAHAARLRGTHDPRAVEGALERCGLREVAGEPLDTLSHGYRQRVGLAQALVHDPAVLVLDEPIQGLDPEQIAEMRGLLERLRGERTIVLSTHILGEVARSCDHLLVLHEGRVAVHGAKDEVLGEEHVLELEVRGALEDVHAALHDVPGVRREGWRAEGSRGEGSRGEGRDAPTPADAEPSTPPEPHVERAAAPDSSEQPTSSIVRLRVEVEPDAALPEVAERVAAALVARGLGLRALSRPTTGDLEALFARLRRSR